jgi:membrane protein DedA with SNARE-associated domain
VAAGEYAILLALAAVGGVGIPGPGDTALIAAALVAAEGNLSIAVVLVVAFVGHVLGRWVGYQLGAKGGRPLMERPGWFEGFRSRAVAKGDELFERYPRAAVLVAPAPLSGIHDVALGLFALASAATGVTWTLSTGLISFLLGEAAKDLVGRIGVQGVLFAVILATVGLVYRFLWRRFVRPDPTGSIPENR